MSRLYNFYKDNKALADSMSKVIGYNFTVTKAEQVTTTQFYLKDGAGASPTISTLSITIKNTGVAPCFFDIYLVAEFVDSTGAAIAQLGKTIRIPKGTFKDGASQEFSFSGAAFLNAVQAPAGIALSLYESEEAFKSGKNPTVRFDNDGLLENKKLLLKE